MAGKPTTTTEIVAYLYAVEGKSPKQIAHFLGKSEVTVWRYLTAARGDMDTKDSKPLIKELTPILDVSEDDRQRILAAVQQLPKYLYPELLHHLHSAFPPDDDGPHPLKGIWVFPSGKGAEAAEDCDAWDQAALAFGRAAAPRVAELLRTARYIGVAWGRTLQSVIQGIVALNPKPRDEGSRATVFPINGDILADVPSEELSSLFADQTRLSPSFLAAQLATAMNGTAERALSLISVPAIIPLKYQRRRFQGRSEADIIKQFVAEIVGYKRIFGDQAAKPKRARPAPDTPPPVADTMDALLVTVGSSDCPRRFWCAAIMNYVGKTVAEIRDLTYGDIGALLVPRKTLGAGQRKEFQAVTDCYTGLKLERVAACAARAKAPDSTASGVIAFGVGRSRRRIMLECFRLGLVNHAVIDEDLAKSLQDWDPMSLMD